ncbi:ABC transporter permease [Mycoplasma enhydrae]|uniref:ABC transporter permease n=1 Tax=Mycoplasma enhydrae TaxID=2499220 RepID=UPI0021E75F60|nr:ABC transporter permease [Mycoplasma enhydrae]
MIKYLKSISTWVTTAVGILIIGLLAALIPNLAIKVNSPNAEIKYLNAVSFIPSVILSYLTGFVTIYSGIKASSMCKDEIENGSFLSILAKPISRTKIIVSKWFALLTIIILHLFLLILSYIIFIYATDVGKNFKPQLEIINKKTLTDNVWRDGGEIFGILILLSLLFSSITLLITTKASLSASIAATVFIGVIIPVSSVFGSFTQKETYRKINGRYLDNIKLLISTTNKQLEKENISFDKNSEIFSTFKNLDEAINEYKIIEKKHLKDNLAEVGFFTNEKNPFHFTKFLDLNYQNKVLISASHSGETFGASSVIDNFREAFEVKNYYYKPMQDDSLYKSRDLEITEKDKVFKEKLITSLKDLEGVRDSGFKLLYNVINEFKKQIDKVPGTASLVKLNFERKDLLLIAAIIETYKNLATNAALTTALGNIKNSAKTDNIISLDNFLPVVSVFIESYNTKTKNLNQYLKNVHENNELDSTAIFLILLNNVFKNNKNLLNELEKRKKDKKIKVDQNMIKGLFSAYYNLESPIAGILFNDFAIEAITKTYKINSEKHSFGKKIGDFEITAKDSEALDKVYSLYKAKNHHLAKLTRVPYMDRRANIAFYSLLTIILTFTSVYILTKQDFR